jgi:predicted nuclease of predicted toxin-antitoxin system
MTPLQDDLKHEVGTAVQQEIAALHPASRLGLSRADDEELLRAAQEQGRILVTRDRDVGALVFVELLGAGVLYLRVLPSTQNTVHGELARVLATCSEQELSSAFVTVERDGHRIRRLPKK